MATQDATGEPKPKKAPKLWRDVAEHRAKNGGRLKPDPENPYCQKCNLFQMGCRRPLEPWGSDEPTLTVAFDAVGYKEDDAGLVAAEGSANGLTRRTIAAIAKEINFDMDNIRWLPLSRCANRTKTMVNYKTKVNWCRAFAVEDLKLHPPRMLLAIGTTALGAFSHKSNAQDWSGKLLTWRGWPDDWLTDNRFLADHPTSPRPDDGYRVPLWAVQSPKLVYATQNQRAIGQWRSQLRRCMELALSGAKIPEYDRSYYRLIVDPAEAAQALDAIPEGAFVSYDTETTGLLPFITGAKVVTHMLRYDDPSTGNPVSLAFPWDFEGSALKPHLQLLRPKLLNALYRSRLRGHHLSFDIIFTYATEEGADLRRLTDAIEEDTRHLAYCIHQSNESLGLELLTYSWCPELAGYEEDFVMRKERADLSELLDPAVGKGGHYANALKLPDRKAHEAYKRYALGDVETVHVSAPRMRTAMKEVKPYVIPLSDPNNLGSFRRYEVPPTSFAYEKIMLRGQRVLTRIMGRGMYIDQQELAVQEDLFPKLIKEAREKLRTVDEQIIKWCDQQTATVPDWKLDLESREQLKTILFTILKLPVKRLTESGNKQFKDLEHVPPERLLEFAAVDKFTLTSLVAENPTLAPLKDYRKLYKAYTMFVRSMRNIKVEGVDKHDRTKDQYLMPDGCVHATFNPTGTSSGRLSSSRPNLQQIVRDSMIKKLFASRFGAEGCIYQFDLSQIELRLLAATCGDPLMVKAYRDKIDLHSLTTSSVFKIPYEHFEKSYLGWLQQHGREKEAKELNAKRAIGKTSNFLCGYGGGAFGLQNSLAEEGVYLDIEECERIVDGMFDTYPRLRQYIGLYKRFIMKHGCAASVFGRVRPLEDVYSEDPGRLNKALRSGFNHLIQSTASDLMLSCCAIIDDLFYDRGLQSILVSTVHDSIVIDARRNELPVIHELCSAVINNMPEVLPYIFGNSVDLSWMTVVPLEGDAEVGATYFSPVKVIEDPVTKQVDWDRLLSPAPASK